MGFVLIETLWNVNLLIPTIKLNICSINRNIVECKFVFETFVPGCDNCINRNIVECK